MRGLQAVLQTMILSLPALFNVFLLLSLGKEHKSSLTRVHLSICNEIVCFMRLKHTESKH